LSIIIGISFICFSTNPFIIDIRSPEHYELGHIDGAVHMSLFSIAEEDNIEDIPKDRTVVVYCYTGQTGAMTTVLLKIMGYENARNLKFGMQAWTANTTVSPIRYNPEIDGRDYEFVTAEISTPKPPPVNQNIGLNDTAFGGFEEPKCRECHSSGLVDRHHLLLYEGYECIDCHNITSQGLEFTRDCLACHFSSPHHVTAAAENGTCSECHGDFVDDFDDGHVIPTYEKSLITPYTNYNPAVYNETGFKIGGCEVCHIAGDSNIFSNAATHHGTNVSCDKCHSGPAGMLDIRKCEDCHGINSLHSIQYDYNNTNGELGYGHIGNDWDCWGCHGWYDLYGNAAATANVAMILSNDVNLGEPSDCNNIVPSINDISSNPVIVGDIVCITGSNFISTTDGGDAIVKVMLDKIEIIPDSVSDNEITITAEVPPGNYRLVVNKEYECIFESNAVSLSVTSEPPTTLVIYG
jgi:rhodanese-related sulfurtransferase